MRQLKLEIDEKKEQLIHENESFLQILKCKTKKDKNQEKYVSNIIKSTKYTIITFLPMTIL